MKKILSSVAAIALAAALISCGDSGDTNNNITNSDTIISVGTPVVTGKAYPGVNYITWTPVANATRYEIYRTADNAAPEFLTVVTAQGGDLGYADFAKDDKDLVDGVTYKYTIFAVGGNSTNVPSRAVYVATSTANATVKAKAPAYGTDLTKFAEGKEKDTDYKAIADYLTKVSKKEGVLEAKNVNNSNIAVAYPVIAGLKYAVKAVNESHLKAGLSTTKATAGFTNEFVGARTANCNLKDVAAYGPGKYTVYLTVAALSDLYTTEAVYSLGEVTFAKIDDTTKIANVNATWASDGKSVNLTWEQAKLANGSKEAITNYHVYRAVGAYTSANFKEGVEITEVTKDVKVVSKLDAAYANQTGLIGSGNTVDALSNLTEGKLKEVCYMVDATADANTPYTYIVTHTNNNGVSDPVFSNALTTWSKETTDVPSFVTTGNNGNITSLISRKDKENTVIKVVGKRANTYQTLSLAYYKLDEVKDGAYKKLITSDFSAGTINSNNDATNETWTGYIEATVGTYVLKLTATDSRGKAEASAYYVIYVTGVGAPNASGITISQPYSGTKFMSADNLAYVVDNNLNDADFTAKTYKYYLTTVTIKQANTTFGDDVTIETSTSAIDLAKHATATTSTEANDSYVAYGLMVGGVAATDTKYTAIVSGVKSETASSGTAIQKVYSVKKTRASDEANLYAYSSSKLWK